MEGREYGEYEYGVRNNAYDMGKVGTGGDKDTSASGWNT
jgi:hypothetical protein